MKLLPGISDIDDLVQAPSLQPMAQGGEVGRGVIEGSIALLDQSRVLLQLRDVLEERGQSAFAFAGNALGAQFPNQRFQAGVVEALAEGVIELHTQALVNGVELDA